MKKKNKTKIKIYKYNNLMSQHSIGKHCQKNLKLNSDDKK